MMPSSRHNKRAEYVWPVLHLSSWLKTSFEDPYGGFFWLGGLRVQDELAEIKNSLKVFWEHYQHVDVGDGGGEPPQRPECTIPFFLHGDEGRGQVKRPILVISYQPLMSWGNIDNVNSSKIHAKDYMHFQFVDFFDVPT